MRFYNHSHAFYAGVDLHARSMFTHILDHEGNTVFEADLPASPDAFRNAIAPFRAGLVVGCECMFSWYWLADLCEDDEIPFTLGHALYMKAIHGGKSKNDRIDAAKIAGLLRGGMFPMPTCRAIHELSRCVATADHEFRRGLDSSGTLPATARHPSGIELAALLGLYVARRGFWDADSQYPSKERY